MCVQYKGDPLRTVGVNFFCKFMMDHKAIVRCIFVPNIVACHVENIIHLRNWKNIENKPVTGCELVDFLYFTSVAEKQSGMEY